MQRLSFPKYPTVLLLYCGFVQPATNKRAEIATYTEISELLLSLQSKSNKANCRCVSYQLRADLLVHCPLWTSKQFHMEIHNLTNEQ